MPKTIDMKGAALAALLALSIGTLEASASEGKPTPGQCDANFAFNSILPSEITPALLEELRTWSGAATVRHEKPGVVYTQEYRSDRLRVFSVLHDGKNVLDHYTCG